MGEYTPDGIHVFSKGWFFVPPAIGLIVSLLAGVLVVFRRRLFGVNPVIPYGVLVLTLLVTAFLTLRAFVARDWSIHVYNSVQMGMSQGYLRGELERISGMGLSTEAEVELCVAWGWREYTTYCGVRGASLPDGAWFLQQGYRKIKEDREYSERLLEPVTAWMSRSHFSPSLSFWRDAGNALINVKIDERQGLLLVSKVDY